MPWYTKTEGCFAHNGVIRNLHVIVMLITFTLSYQHDQVHTKIYMTLCG